MTGRSISGAVVRAPDRSPTREQALRIHTIGSATMAGDEAKRGTLEAGKWADLVVLSEDYFTVPAEQISRIKPDATMVGGRTVYQSGRIVMFGVEQIRFGKSTTF